eukprot:jgi/Tetstr1/442985/TSEL_031045.t1
MASSGAPEADDNGAAEKCLLLLKGPSDEHRFVGLLLAPRLLMSGKLSEQALVDAMGLEFLERLLLPLSQSETGGARTSDSSESLASCALAISVLSRCCRLPSVCQSDALKRQLPHLDMDAQVLQETLGCLSGMLHAGKPAREALWECGCVEACAALLSDEATAAACLAAAFGLLRSLLAYLAQEGDEARSVFGHRAAQCGSLVAALARHVAYPSASRPADAASSDEAMIQLQAVSAMLLLLRPWMKLADAAEIRERLGAASQHWARRVREGLHLLTVGRVGLAQRHAALSLSALMVELLGPDWLCGAGHPALRQLSESPEKSSLILPTVEISKVELAVLLHDLTAPAHSVAPEAPRGGGGATPGSAESSTELSGGAGVVLDGMGMRGMAQESAETAGDSRDRARQLVPPCFVLLEAAVAALVSGTDCPDGGEQLPCADRIFKSVSEAVDVALQFLEDAQSEPAACSDAYADPVVLASVRFVARFAAEALPFCEERLAAMLPFLLRAHGGLGHPAQGTFFMLPVLAAGLGSPTEPGAPQSGATLKGAVLSDEPIDSIVEFLGKNAASARALMASDPFGVLLHAASSSQLSGWAAEHAAAASEHILWGLDWHLLACRQKVSSVAAPRSEAYSFWKQTVTLATLLCASCESFRLAAQCSPWFEKASATGTELPNSVAALTSQLVRSLAQ